MYCGHCRGENPPHNRFCMHCGMPFPPPEVTQRILAPRTRPLTDTPLLAKRGLNPLQRVVLVIGCIFGVLIVLGTIGEMVSPTEQPTAPPRASGPSKMSPAAHTKNQPAPSASSVRSLDWANFTYVATCDGNRPKPIAVKKGKAMTDGFLLTVSQPTYGDLTGDGHQEAVIPYQCIGADSGPTRFLIYTGHAAHPILLGAIPPKVSDGIPNPQSVSISHKTLHIAYLGYSAMAPHCCPDLSVTTAYRWTGKTFSRVSFAQRPYVPPAPPTATPIPALTVVASVDPDPVIDDEPATIDAVTSPGSSCTVSVVYASGYAARSYSLQAPAVADDTGTAWWSWTPDTSYPGPAVGTVTCTDGAQSATNEVDFDVQ